jgi:hypothetical protein
MHITLSFENVAFSSGGRLSAYDVRLRVEPNVRATSSIPQPSPQGPGSKLFDYPARRGVGIAVKLRPQNKRLELTKREASLMGARSRANFIQSRFAAQARCSTDNGGANVKRTLLWTCAIGFLLYGPMVLLHGACIAGYGPWAIPGSELFVFPPLIAAVLLLLALPFLAFRRFRSEAVRIAIVALGLVLLFVPAMAASWQLRNLGFHLAAARAEPLIAAIERYTADHGGPPESLDLVVPTYLSELPKRVPDLQLVTGERARREFGGNDWALYAVVSTGLLNWDEFIYYPNQQYPDSGHGNGISRIDRWAYVHE